MPTADVATASPSARPSPVPPANAAERAFYFLQELAADLSQGAITFPTFVDATIKIGRALDDPAMDAERLALVVSSEPLLAAKVVHLANSVALNPAGRKIGDVKTAVTRVGFTTVRSTAAAVAIAQVRASEDLRDFRVESERVWRHSLEVAAVAFVLARALTSLRPDEALFAGLVHDIGRFYLLARASRYPELKSHREELESVIHEWHPAIGEAILQQLALPDALTAAVAEHESAAMRFPPRTLTDIVVIANLATGPRDPAPTDGRQALPEDSPVFKLLAEAAGEVQSLIAALQ